MKEGTYKIADSEWQIMQVIWEESPLTTTQIIEALKPKTSWSPKTIHTLISRLVKKAVLGVNRGTAQYRYYPLVSKEECIRDETRSFIQKVYGGSLHLLIANFVKQENLSQKEIEDLKRLLDERLK